MSRPFQRVLFDIDAITTAVIPPKETATHTVLCHLLRQTVANKYLCQSETGRAVSDYRKDISLLKLEYGWRIDGHMGLGFDDAVGLNRPCKLYWVDNDWLAGVMAGSEQIAAFVRMVCWSESANDNAA